MHPVPPPEERCSLGNRLCAWLCWGLHTPGMEHFESWRQSWAQSCGLGLGLSGWRTLPQPVVWIPSCGFVGVVTCPPESCYCQMLMVNFADERDEAKGAILNYLERSEILARNISLQNNLEKNYDEQTCFKTSMNTELWGAGEKLNSSFRNATANNKLKTVKWQQQMKKNNLGYYNCIVMPFVHWLLGILMYIAKAETFQPLPVYAIYVWSNWHLIVKKGKFETYSV